MRPRVYSAFWLAWTAGLICLSSAWEGRDPVPEEQLHPAEDLDMAAWLRLPEHERAALVEQYAHRKPKIVHMSTEERRRAVLAV